MEPENQNGEMNTEELVENNEERGDHIEEEQEFKEESEAGIEPEKKKAEDFSEYKNQALLGYILPFLFFLPLMDEKTKNVPYVRFHAGQQLNLLVLAVTIYFIANILMGFFYMSYLFTQTIYQIMNLVYLGYVVLVIFGAVQAYKGEMKKLPLVGKFTLLK